jgi:hydrogenase nickel incorporation protein HypB
MDSNRAVGDNWSANEHLAKQNRATLEVAGVFGVNLMAAPGAGKTSLILRTAEGAIGKSAHRSCRSDAASVGRRKSRFRS